MLFDTGTMSEDSSVFSCLPLAVRDSILRQAFQQLDQRHLFGVAPRVCRLWHQLSLSIIINLVAEIKTAEAAQQLQLWIQNHGAGLDSMDVHFHQDVCDTTPSSLMPSLRAARSMRSLSLSTAYGLTPLDALLPTFSCLTTLSIRTCHPAPHVLNSILNLTQLSSLSLRSIIAGGREGEHGSVSPAWEWEPFMEQLAADLVELTSLDFSRTGMDVEALVHLHKLPKLKQLCVGGLTSASELSHLVGLPITLITILVEPHLVDGVSAWLLGAVGHLQELNLLNLTSRDVVMVNVCTVPLHKAVQLKSFTGYKVVLSMAHIASLTQLTSLDLEACGIDDTAVCRLSSLSNLRELCLSQNPGFTGSQGSMEVLATSMPHLTSLKLYYNALGYEAAQLAFGQRVADARGGALTLRPLSVAEL